MAPMALSAACPGRIRFRPSFPNSIPPHAACCDASPPFSPTLPPSSAAAAEEEGAAAALLPGPGSSLALAVGALFPSRQGGTGRYSGRQAQEPRADPA